jgi:DNA helicase-2/ATP-dependent DNA helicase PcrA
VKFFEQAHIKDVVAYLRTRENPRDELSWVRLLRLWPGVGMQTAESLAAELRKAERDPADVIAAWAASSRGRGKRALEQLHALWQRLHEPDSVSPGAAIREIVTAHYADYADRAFTNASARKEDLEHLAGYAERYRNAQEFLSELALVQGMAAENIVAAEPSDDKLVLSTVHQAKGLEWPICFVLWLAEGRFPSAQAMRNPVELEEERRLFYVAATRAMAELYLIYPTIEESHDGPSKLMRPSRFLVELDHSPPVFDRWQICEEPVERAE